VRRHPVEALEEAGALLSEEETRLEEPQEERREAEAEEALRMELG
jgi:hypothetical protein